MIKLISGIKTSAKMLIFSHHDRFFMVNQRTMEPNICRGDKLVIGRIKNESQIKRGDVVFFKDNFGSACNIRRVIGLPGEMIEIKKGKIFINREHFNGIPEIKRDFFCNMPLRYIMSRCYFLMGDDMNLSMKSRQDSSYFGSVPLENITGKVIGVCWPPKHAKYLV
jgi:signal peptidase I